MNEHYDNWYLVYTSSQEKDAGKRISHIIDKEDVKFSFLIVSWNAGACVSGHIFNLARVLVAFQERKFNLTLMFLLK